MKFSLFGHMMRTTPEQPHQELYQEFLSLCKMADEGGMRAIWTGEHHGMEFTIAPNPFISLVDLGHHTKNVRLGTGTIVAPFWHPIKLAGEAAMADLILGGRLELGVARGAYSYEYERLMPGMDAWQAGKRMRETLPLLPRLWQGDCVHDGEFFQFPSTTSAPKPLQHGGPPIWVAARDPNSHEFAVHNGFNVQVTPLWNNDAEVVSLMERFNDACAGFNGPRPKIMLLHHAFVVANEADAEEVARHFSRFYCYFGAWFKNERPVRQGLIEPLSDEEIDGNAMMAPEIMMKNLAIGTSRQLIDHLKRYEDMGFDEYSYWIDNSMPIERNRQSLRRFIEEVMPAFS